MSAPQPRPPGSERVPGAPQVTITWIGHATVLVEVEGHRVLTDPALTGRLAHLRRRGPLPTVGQVDTVLISHLHMDHLHLRSLRALGHVPRMVVPAGSRSLVKSVASGVIDEVVPGDQLVLSAADAPVEISVRVVHAEHSGRRGPHSRIAAAPVGYVLDVGGHTIYFAGDTDLFDEMHDLGHIDVALVPIWGWGPTLGERHLDPSSAAEATLRIDPVRVVPIHWGTYSPIRPQPGSPPWLDHPLEAFRSSLVQIGLDDRLHSVRPGGSVTLPV